MKSKKYQYVLFAGIILMLSCFCVVGENKSVNAVGFSKIPIHKGRNIVSCPFNMIGGGNMTLESMFGKQPLEKMSVIFVFETNPQEYVQYTYSAHGWVDVNGKWCGDTMIPRGQAFWVESPTDTVVTVMGEVPSEPVTRTTLLHGLQMVAPAYPTTNTLNKTVPSDGDIIYTYLTTNNVSRYILEFYIGGMGWVDQNGHVAEEKNFVCCDGLWYISASESNKVWEQKKPYPWP
jgi:hypothetical protein